jgi:hypothetical protein
MVAAKKSTIDAQTGSIRSSIFSSSTWDAVQSLHGLVDAAVPFSPVLGTTMAALSKNLARRSRLLSVHSQFYIVQVTCHYATSTWSIQTRFFFLLKFCTEMLTVFEV